MSFLKWALGVHKKSSNIGCWGETGRYPLLYQSIKMSLKYFQRIDKLKPTSFVHLALVEHKRMNLPWYSNIECLLKIDEIYHKDHVTAFKHMHKEFNQNITKNDLTKNLNGNKILNPLPSKKFRVEEILKHLKSHFIKCWNYEKRESPKLNLFYDKIKPNFSKETYLDLVKNAAYRYRTTRLRISAHDLKIEKGRYKKIPRNK